MRKYFEVARDEIQANQPSQESDDSDDESEKSISDTDESFASEKECTGCEGSGLYDIGMCFQCNVNVFFEHHLYTN